MERLVSPVGVGGRSWYPLKGRGLEEDKQVVREDGAWCREGTSSWGRNSKGEEPGIRLSK